MRASEAMKASYLCAQLLDEPFVLVGTEDHIRARDVKELEGSRKAFIALGAIVL